MIKPAAARLFQEKGIDVHLTALRVNGQDGEGSIEIDERANKYAIQEDYF